MAPSQQVKITTALHGIQDPLTGLRLPKSITMGRVRDWWLPKRLCQVMWDQWERQQRGCEQKKGAFLFGK